MHRLVALGLVLLVAPGVATADDKPFTIGPQPAWILLGGVTTGGTIALADRGAFVGGELSLARLNRGHFIGLYADGYYDWGVDGAYVTGGLELGHKFVGLDGGLALRFANGDRDVGVTGRLTVGLGMVGVYGRYAYFNDVMENDHVIQIGLVIKLPFATARGM